MPFVVAFVDCRLTGVLRVAVTIGEREVCWVVGHRVTFGLDANTDVRQREVGGLRLSDGYRLNTVTLVSIHCVQCFVQFQVGVQRVVFRTALLLGNAIVDGCRDVHLVGEEFSQFEVGGQRVGFVIVRTALGDTFLETAEALGDDLTRQIDVADVRQLDIQVTRCGPTAIVVDFLQAQFVDPYLARLETSGNISYTNHHRLHFAQRRVAENGDAVVGIVGVVVAEFGRVTGSTARTSPVTGLLQIGQFREVDIEHILLRPYGTTVVEVVFVIVVAVGRQLQRDEIFVVVVAVVAAETDEYCQLVILQRGFVVDEVVGVNEHLDMLIAAQVERRVTVDGFRLVLRQVLDHQTQRLLVGFGQLGLRGVGDARDARRQYVVDGLAVVVLLDIDRADLQLTAVAGASQLLVVQTPLATHEVQ